LSSVTVRLYLPTSNFIFLQSAWTCLPSGMSGLGFGLGHTGLDWSRLLTGCLRLPVVTLWFNSLAVFKLTELGATRWRDWPWLWRRWWWLRWWTERWRARRGRVVPRTRAETPGSRRSTSALHSAKMSRIKLTSHLLRYTYREDECKRNNRRDRGRLLPQLLC